MAKDGYCFVTEQRSGDSQPRDYIYLVSELSDAAEISIAKQTKPESMDLQSHHLRGYFQREKIHLKEKYHHLFSPLPPKLVLTYEWSMSFRELRGYLNNKNIRKHNTTSAEMFIHGIKAEKFNSLIDYFDSIVVFLRFYCYLWCIPIPSFFIEII